MVPNWLSRKKPKRTSLHD